MRVGDPKWRRTEVPSKDAIQLTRPDRELTSQLGYPVLVEVPAVDESKSARQDGG
jgi:hypothetical protein